MLSIKDLVFNKRLARKLVNAYISLYIIDEIVSTNTINLWLPTSMRIYLVVCYDSKSLELDNKMKTLY